MKIIALEGIDKCGKASQASELTKRLTESGYKVMQSEFHRYDTPTGKIIQDWLFHKYEANKQTIELIMAADKYAQQDWFFQLNNERYDFLVLDRYITSQKVYAMAKRVNKDWMNNLLQYLIKPDLEFLIDIPVDVSMKRNPKYGATSDKVENDRHEKDFNLLANVRSFYIDLFTADIDDMSKVIIDGTQTIYKVSDDIWRHVKNI